MTASLQDIKKLYRGVIIPFHTLERDTTLPLPDHRTDNDAEHSWSLSLLAIALASEIDEKLDIGKVAIYASIHDIVEVYAGDTSVWADRDALASKDERESAAIEKLKQEHPGFRQMFKYLDDYNKKDSSESKFVYALDKFINLLSIIEDNGHYYRKNQITRERYLEHLKSHRTKAHSHPVIGAYYDQLREAFDKNPANFFRYDH